MTEKRLAELRALAAKATPGPWVSRSYPFQSVDEMAAEVGKALRNNPDGRRVTFVYRNEKGGDGYWLYAANTGNGPTSEANAAFIAVAREAVPELLAEVARLRGIVGRLVGDDEGTW